MRTDILNIDDIKKLVDHFYTSVRENETLGPIFNEKIGERWPEHLDKMYRFWQTVLLEEHTYNGSPFVPHAKLPVEWKHFEMWLAMFSDTVDEFFEGPNATKAKWQGQRMAEMFHHKIEYYKNHPAIPLL